MPELPETAVRILTARGIDPNTVPREPEPFDLVAFRTEQALTVLDRAVPAKFAGVETDHPRLIEWCDRYQQAPAKAPSLLLAGPTGSGKTHHAYGLIRRLSLALAATGKGLRWRFVTHPEFNDALRPKPDDSHTWAIDDYLNVDLLVFDDLGAGKQSEWTGDSLYRLVNHRWSHNLTTVYTTNLDPADLETAVGDRVTSRVFDTTRVAIRGVDRRRVGAA